PPPLHARALSLHDALPILVMDNSNLADVNSLRSGTDQGRVRLFRDFDPEFPGSEVPDPYYGGEEGFGEVLSMVERTSARLVELVDRKSTRLNSSHVKGSYA